MVIRTVLLLVFWWGVTGGGAGFLRAQTGKVLSLQQGWKFQTGDNPEYSRPDYDDSGWKDIRVDRIWEDQGYDRLDGYAWFRLRVAIPSSLKEGAYLQEGLRIFLGKINNFDQSYLNGRLIGTNGRPAAGAAPDDSFIKAEQSLWNVARCYVLPLSDPRILWDRENVLAIRVYDEGGQGGLYTGDQSIRLVVLPDYLESAGRGGGFRLQGGNYHKTVRLRNVSPGRPLPGNLTIRIIDKLDGRELSRRTEETEIPPGSEIEREVQIPRGDRPVLLEYGYDFQPAQDRSIFREEVPYLLTPPPPAAPRINGPAVTGVRPGHPFLYAIPATGEAPLFYSARKLPAGLALDGKTGIITGRIAKAGEYRVDLEVRNRRGKDRRRLMIKAGDAIALTPPMGWNSWNCWGLSVDAAKVLASARSFKDKGLAAHGWSCINIDDGWEIPGDSPLPKRAEDGTILTNEKFPDMKALGDQIHAMGLKFGIYSSPGPLTCGGYTASWQHERQDARTFASWGIDYLKYDWCSYDGIAPDRSPEELKKPYRLMRDALAETDRDIVYSLCQYGMGNVWEWGAEVGGNLWRTTGDITDTWESMSKIGFSQTGNTAFAGPGHWNDPDMLVVGRVGWGPDLHDSRLTPDEQYTHISLWCLLAAPLLIGCDLEGLDEFTLNLLTNDEVLAVDQDIPGRQASPAVQDGDVQVWVKPLADGSRAAGIFNLGPETARYSLDFTRAGLPERAQVRDLWRQKDLGRRQGKMPLAIPSHGVMLLRLTAVK